MDIVLQSILIPPVDCLSRRFGTTITSQFIDANNDLTPAYAIYERGILSKVAMIDFMDNNQTGDCTSVVVLFRPSLA